VPNDRRASQNRRTDPFAKSLRAENHRTLLILQRARNDLARTGTAGRFTITTIGYSTNPSSCAEVISAAEFFLATLRVNE